MVTTKRETETLVSLVETGTVESIELPEFSYESANQNQRIIARDFGHRVEAVVVFYGIDHVTIRLKAKESESRRCPGCGGYVTPQFLDSVVGRCDNCGGLVSVKPTTRALIIANYVKLNVLQEATDQEDSRYFDLRYFEDGPDSAVRRVHGWYDPSTRAVVQFG